MKEPSMHVCRVDTPEGCKDYLTLLPPEIVFAQGLAPEAIVGMLLRALGPREPITPQTFALNRAFVEFMHAVIARYGPHQTGFQAEAKRLSEGWVYVIDRRTPTPEGAVPSEDILGAFEVKRGEVVSGSYQANPKHMILSPNGFFQLGEGLQACLLRELETRNPGGLGDERARKPQ